MNFPRFHDGKAGTKPAPRIANGIKANFHCRFWGLIQVRKYQAALWHSTKKTNEQNNFSYAVLSVGLIQNPVSFDGLPLPFEHLCASVIASA